MVLGCQQHQQHGSLDLPYQWRIKEVTATAYNSLPNQTSATHPNIAAWGDTLKPGDRCIAVSRDLLEEGLTHNTRVKLDGFEGVYVIKDKMNRRWKNRIDIYMGLNLKKAKAWGKRKLKIRYIVPKDSL